MKQGVKLSWWLRAQSYVRPVLLENASSIFNPRLQVVLYHGKLQLQTPNAIYSYADRYDNFSKVFDAMHIRKDESLGRVLVLGVGLASIPYMFEKKYQCHYELTGVEIDEQIIDLAKRYVLHELKMPVHLVGCDAQDFVAQCTEKYDGICVDVFLDAVIPQSFGQLAFLQQLQYLLKPDGWLIYNKLAFNEADKTEALTFFDNVFCRAFPSAQLMDTQGNYMLLNQPISTIRQIKHAKHS